LQLEDISQRVERTGELLERFAGWFEIGEVLAVLPDEWSVDVCGRYIVSCLRALVRERTESGVVRALCDAQNSQMSSELVEKREEVVVEGME